MAIFSPLRFISANLAKRAHATLLVPPAAAGGHPSICLCFASPQDGGTDDFCVTGPVDSGDKRPRRIARDRPPPHLIGTRLQSEKHEILPVLPR